MSDTVTRLVYGEKEYVLVGTAHVSSASIDEVRTVIRAETPDRVAVELDSGRYQTLIQPDHWEKLDLFKVLKSGKGFLLLANLALSSFQRKLGEELDVKPGQEMLAGVQEAEALGKPYSLIDREIQVTLNRAWKKSSFWGKNKLLAALLGSVLGDEKVESSQIEGLKDRNELDSMMDGLAKELPTVKKVLIDERDQYLASSLFQAEGRKLVAVVGAGHVPGMVRWLKDLHEGKATVDLEEISRVPAPSLWSKVWPWLIPAVIVALFIGGFFLKGPDAFLGMLGTWALATGGAAALGTLAAGGHPLTILTALVLAPITALHPLLGIGMFTGLSEVFFRKPRVSDLEGLSHDITSVKGFYKNRVTRTLLVFLFSSLGGSIAVYMNLPLLTKALFG